MHVEDVARTILAAIEKPEAAGQVYNLVDYVERYTQLARFAGEALGVEPSIDVPEPEPIECTFDCAAAKALVHEHPDFLNRGEQGLRSHFEVLAEGGEG